MRRDTLIALAVVCVIFWAGIYFLFSLNPVQAYPANKDANNEDLIDRNRYLIEYSMYG